MKKCLALLLILVCLFSLVACQNGNNEENKGNEGNDILNPHFTGKVVEVYDGGCLLEVTDKGNWNFSIGDKVEVHTDIENCPEYSVDDYLRISFDGLVAESYPPQIHGVTIVSKTDNTGNSIE